jgi:hypothetical protein
VAAVTATACEEISRKWRNNDTGFFSLGFQDGQDKLNNFPEDSKWVGSNFPPQMELPVALKRKRGCPIILFKANATVTQNVKDKGNIALGFGTHDF